MTTEEKAKELVGKYNDALFTHSDADFKNEKSKEFALIAVDEINEIMKSWDAQNDTSHSSYWLKVKEELIK